MKNVHIRSYSGPYFAAFGLSIQSQCEKIRSRITLNTDTIYAVPVTDPTLICLRKKEILCNVNAGKKVKAKHTLKQTLSHLCPRSVKVNNVSIG